MCTYDELCLGILLEDPWEDIGNEVHSLLQTPSSNEYEQLSFRVLLEASPLLGLAPKLASACLEFLIDGDRFVVYKSFLAPLSGIRWVRIGQLPDLGQSPENRVSREGPVTVLLRYTNSTKAFLVDAQVTSTGMQQVEH